MSEIRDVSVSTAKSTSPDDFTKFAASKTNTSPAAVSPLIPGPNEINKPVQTKPVAVVKETVKEEPVKEVVKEAVVLDEDATDDADETETEDQEDKSAEVVVEKQKNIKSSFKKRVDQLQIEREEARAESAALRKQLEQHTRQEEEAKAVEQPKQQDQNKPQSFQYNTLAEFQEALVDWKLAQRDRVDDKRQRDQIMAAQAKSRETTWNTRETAAKVDLGDYDAVVTQDLLRDTNLLNASHTASREFLTESEHGPVVLYNLGENTALAKSFAEASSIQQIKILTRLESSIESAQAARSVNTDSKAAKKAVDLPAPPKKHGNPGIRGSDKTIAEAADFSEYARIRAPEIKTARPR